MKIKKSVVQQIIKEEVVKVKKMLSLKEERKAILKQLGELYKQDDLEKK